jgi:hypothetical protein
LLFEPFEIIAHGAVFPRKHSVGKSCQHFEAKMVGKEKKFSETEGPENLKHRS